MEPKPLNQSLVPTIQGDIPDICVEGENSVPPKSPRKLSILAGDSPHHMRASSLREGLKKRKRSIIQTIEQAKLKNFKSFVESKILSRSNLELAMEEESAETNDSTPSLGTTIAVNASSLSNQQATNQIKRKSMYAGTLHGSVST